MTYIRFSITVLLFAISFVAFGQGTVDIIVRPQKPAVQERFSVTFKITNKNGGSPKVSFDVLNLEKIGSSSTSGPQYYKTIVNGNVDEKYIFSKTFYMFSDKIGPSYLKNIIVDTGDGVIKKSSKKIYIGKKSARPRVAFVRVVPSKKQMYKGEGLSLDYYLYRSSTRVSLNDIKEFPTFPNFYVRSKNVVDSPSFDITELNGFRYERMKFFSATIFPLKSGKIVIPDITAILSISSNSFMSFGRRESIVSDKLVLEVLPLPEEAMPVGFSGIIGRPEVKLKVSKTKFLANSPIEYSVSLKSNGFLENVDFPNLFKDDKIELFDKKSKIDQLESNVAEKTFDFTLLGKGPVVIPSRVAKISYFNPRRKVYESIKVDIPSVKIVGISKSSTSVEVLSKGSHSTSSNYASNDIPRGLIAPIFNNNVSGRSNWLLFLNYILFVIYVGIAIIYVFKKIKTVNVDSKISEYIDKIKKYGPVYSNVFALLHNLKDVQSDNFDDEGISEVISNSNLSENAKNYFISLYEQAEKEKFNNGTIDHFKFEKKYFAELLVYIERKM